MAETPAENEHEETEPRTTMETARPPRPRRGDEPVPDVMGGPNSAPIDVMGSRTPVREETAGRRTRDREPQGS